MGAIDTDAKEWSQGKGEGLILFINAMIYLFEMMDNSGYIIFNNEFRNDYRKSAHEAIEMLKERMDMEPILSPHNYPSMIEAGLVGSQFDLKMNAFSSTMDKLEEDGGIDVLSDALDLGEILLASLAGAIPGFGSFAQELSGFAAKNIKNMIKKFIFRRG